MKKITVLLTLFILLSFAQPFQEHDPRAIIEKVRIYRLTKELDLTTEQSIKFFPKLHELQRIDQDFRNEQKDILLDLKNLVNKEAPEQQILEHLQRYEKVFKRKVDAQIEKLKEIRQILTPSQEARYLIFQDNFEREIREMIKEIKKHHPRN